MTTLEQVLMLLSQLSPIERTQVLEVLESNPRVAARRAENQVALAHLDARVATDEDDSWWEDFTDALDSDRLSNRPLYADHSSRPA